MFPRLKFLGRIGSLWFSGTWAPTAPRGPEPLGRNRPFPACLWGERSWGGVSPPPARAKVPWFAVCPSPWCKRCPHHWFAGHQQTALGDTRPS